MATNRNTSSATSQDALQLVYEFTCHVACGAPHDVGEGPLGRRHYYPMTDGALTGPRLSGKLLGEGGDWMLTSPDGFMRMDVRVQIQTNDGAVLCAHYFGPAEANPKMIDATKQCKETYFSDQYIRSHWRLESGAPQYAWVNQTVFVGEGRVLPFAPGVLGFEHRVYRVA